MPKVTITFNLPEERFEHQAAIHGADWRGIVSEVATFLRNRFKYGHDFKTADDALEAVRDTLWAECEANNLDPWED